MQTYDDQADVDRIALRPAPAFVERDHGFWPVKLSRYLTRHRIVVAFFDGHEGADQSQLLLRLREVNDALEQRGYVVVAVGNATPIENRQSIRRAGGFPFPVLADVDEEMNVDLDTTRAWGRWDAAANRLRPGIVLVDRTGFVKSRRGVPLAEDDPIAAIDAILENRT